MGPAPRNPFTLIATSLQLPGEIQRTPAQLMAPLSAGEHLVHTDGQTYSVTQATVVIDQVAGHWEETERILELQAF